MTGPHETKTKRPSRHIPFPSREKTCVTSHPASLPHRSPLFPCHPLLSPPIASIHPDSPFPPLPAPPLPIIITTTIIAILPAVRFLLDPRRIACRARLSCWTCAWERRASSSGQNFKGGLGFMVWGFGFRSSDRKEGKRGEGFRGGFGVNLQGGSKV